MRDEPQRGDFVQVHYIHPPARLSSGHTVQPGHWVKLDQFKIIYRGLWNPKGLWCWRHLYVGSGMWLLERMRICPRCYAPSCFINHILFLQFNSPGIGAKNRFPPLMPAKAGKEKGVSFQFKCYKVNIQPPHPSLQISFTLQSQCSIGAVNSIQNTDILHPCWGILQWFLMLTEKWFAFT